MSVDLLRNRLIERLTEALQQNTHTLCGNRWEKFEDMTRQQGILHGLQLAAEIVDDTARNLYNG